MVLVRKQESLQTECIHSSSGEAARSHPALRPLYEPVKEWTECRCLESVEQPLLRGDSPVYFALPTATRTVFIFEGGSPVRDASCPCGIEWTEELGLLLLDVINWRHARRDTGGHELWRLAGEL